MDAFSSANRLSLHSKAGARVRRKVRGLQEQAMRACLRLAAIVLLVLGAGFDRAGAQSKPQPATHQYSSNEVLEAGHQFFGTTSRGLASIVERAVSNWGLPNGHVLGQEGGGAFVAGLRYGEGMLYTKNAGDRRVYWQGPSVGFDWGCER